MANTDLTFVHAASGAELDAELDDQMTAEQVIQALIDNEFVPALTNPQQYYTLQIKGKSNVAEGQTLAAAGVAAHDTIAVHATQRGGNTRESKI